MFTIKCDGHVLFDLKSHIVLTNPKLCMEENAAGSLEFDIDPEHPLYDSIEPMVSEITVYQDGDEIWSGRPIEQKDNFWGMRSVYCEGELSYLCDTIQPPSESHLTGTSNVRQWIEDRLAIHNSKAPPDKQFLVGAVTVVEPGTLYRYTNYENTLECINEKLIKSLGGHLRVRKENGKRYLDYYQDYPGAADQTIRFGINLLEYSKTLTMADIATVCVPLGARQEEKDFAALEKYLDVSSANGGSIYVENSAGVSGFGRIIKVVHWDDVTTASALLSKARAWLNDAQYEGLALEVKALDFHLVDNDTPCIKLLDKVLIISEPHGLNKWFPVTKMDIPLDNPAGMIFTLGMSSREPITTSTQSLRSSVGSISESLPGMESSILKQATQNATALITSGALGGHVVVLPDEIYITDSANLNSARKVWRWNLNGLGYSSTGINGSFGTAMTMDGSIVADRITTGKLSANRISGGTLKLGGKTNGNGTLYMYGSDGKTEIGHWDKDGLVVSKGTIKGAKIEGANISGSEIYSPNINLGYYGKIEFGDTGGFSDGARIARGGIFIGPVDMGIGDPNTQVNINGLETNGSIMVREARAIERNRINITSQKISFCSIWEESGYGGLVDDPREIARIGIENSDEFTINAPKGNIHLKTNYGIKVYSGSTAYTGYSGTRTINSKSCRFVKGFLVSVTGINR